MTNQSQDDSHLPKIPWLIALIPFIVLVVLQIIVIQHFGSDALEGASQTMVLLASAVAVAIAMIFYKVKWNTINDAIMENVKFVSGAIFILFLIGAVSGSWMLSGVVPTMIVYGMKLLSPALFLMLACLISAIVSVITGSSWTTVATVGVALIGIGTALGFSAGWIAGAIISGAYFGDKVSPLSDTTVLASTIGEVPLFTHIRYLLITTVPTFTITLIIFLVASLTHSSNAAIRTAEFSEGLQNTFVINPWLMLVPLFTLILILMKLPATIVLFLSALTAGIVMIFVQPDVIHKIGNEDNFINVVQAFATRTAIDTGNPTLNDLVQTRGMQGMLNTVFLIFCASAFGGALSGSGMMKSLTDLLAHIIRGRRTLVTATVGTGIFSNMATGDQYLSILLTGNIFKDLYKNKGYEGRLMSRSTEDSATVTSVLVPWNTCSMTQSMVLQISPFTFIPYCFFNIISPLMSIFIAIIGYKIYKKSYNKN